MIISKFLRTMSLCVLTAAMLGSAQTAFADATEDWARFVKLFNPLAEGVVKAQENISEMKVEQRVRVINPESVELKYYWTAAGCAGLVDGVALVCHTQRVTSRSSGEYAFKKGTSARHLRLRAPADVIKARPDKSSCRSDEDVNRGGPVNDVELEAGCGNVKRTTLPPNASAVRAAPDRAYTLQVQSAIDEPVKVYFGSPACKARMDNIDNVCQSIVLGPKARGSINVNAADLATFGVIAFKGEKPEHQAAAKLEGKSFAELQPKQIFVR